MARIRNGILGGFSNKVGEVIGQNYAGISTMRAMPKYVTNPRTPAQEVHRAKMALAGSFLSAFTRGLSFSTWNKNAVDNAFNGALRENFKTFVDDPNAGLEVDLLALNMGTYVGVPLTSPTLVSALLDANTGNIELELSWDSKSESVWASDNDTVILFAVCEHQIYKPGQRFTPLFCDVLPVERVAGGSTAFIYVGDSVVAGDSVYVAFGVVAKCMVAYGYNPQNPSETIKIPSSNIAKSSRPSGQQRKETPEIPAKNVVRFSAGASLKKGAQNKS